MEFNVSHVNYNMTYLLNAIGLTPGGCSTLHIYTQTIHRTTQLTYLGRVRAVPRLCELSLAFGLQLSKKHGKNLSQQQATWASIYAVT